MITFIVGIPLIVIGVILLVNEIKEGNSSKILIKSVILLFWILFTISNYILYKKEKKKESVV